MRAVTLLYRHGSEHRRPEPHPNSHPPPPTPTPSLEAARLPTDHHLSAGATALSRLSAGPSARRPGPPHPRVQNRSGSPRWCMAGSSSPPRRGAAHLPNRRAGRLLHDHGPSGPPPNRGSTTRCPTKRGPRSPRLPETVTDQIVALYVDEQLSAPAIGRITCLAVSTVRRTLDRNGVTRRHDRSRGKGRAPRRMSWSSSSPSTRRTTGSPSPRPAAASASAYRPGHGFSSSTASSPEPPRRSNVAGRIRRGSPAA